MTEMTPYSSSYLRNIGLLNYRTFYVINHQTLGRSYIQLYLSLKVLALRPRHSSKFIHVPISTFLIACDIQWHGTTD